MKSIKSLIAIASLIIFISACTNNNNNTGGVDSSSVSTNPAMGGSNDSGITSSDSTDIRMPMADSSGNSGSSAGSPTQSGGSDSTNHVH
jgi:hypothetical protein